jgi:hypothetical protein
MNAYPILPVETATKWRLFLANRLVHSRACDGLADAGINVYALATSYGIVLLW